MAAECTWFATLLQSLTVGLSSSSAAAAALRLSTAAMLLLLCCCYAAGNCFQFSLFCGFGLVSLSAMLCAVHTVTSVVISALCAGFLEFPRFCGGSCLGSFALHRVSSSAVCCMANIGATALACSCVPTLRYARCGYLSCCALS